MGKGKGRHGLADIAAKQKENASIEVSSLEKVALGLHQSEEDNERPWVSLKYYHPSFECFSAWDEDELKAFSEFCQKLSQRKWNDIYKTGGQLGHKTGLGYTVHKTTKLPDKPDLSSLSPDISFFELRVTQTARVHGFRVKEAFFLVWLDRTHRICR